MEDRTNQESRQSQEKFDPAIRPGGVFMAQLLMEQPCPTPSGEQMTQVLSQHLGHLELFSNNKNFALFAAQDYIARFKDNEVPVQLSIMNCEPFHGEQVNEEQRSQMWNCQKDRDRILSQCRYSVLIHDLLGGGLDCRCRANMLMDFLEAALELYPNCQAVYFLNSGKLILADDIRNSTVTGLDRYIQFCVNVRFFNISGTNDHIVDTLGLSLLYIEDLQYHFHDMEPNWVVGHAYSTASYVLANSCPIKDGDTISGISDGHLAAELRWKCHFEDALVKPERAVLDICMGEYAAGTR